jgi:hypothetical protein
MANARVAVTDYISHHHNPVMMETTTVVMGVAAPAP